MDPERLRELVDERHSIRQIAAACGMSYTNIRYWLRVHGLKTHGIPAAERKINKSTPRRCSCGETDRNKFYGNKTQICARCHNKDVMARGRELRKKAITLLGGKCSRCGYDECEAALDPHHLDPTKKDAGFRHWRGWSWKRVERELKLCVLLCKNCHAREHWLLRRTDDSLV
jgi:hypothetical protein